MIKVLTALVVVCVMLSPSAMARSKRFHTLEAYYAWKHSKHNHSHHSRRHRVRDERMVGNSRSEDNAGSERVQRLVEQSAVPYPYAVGNTISDDLSGAFPYFYDRCHQPSQPTNFTLSGWDLL